MAHLLRYDSNLGPFQGEVELADGVLRAAGEEIKILSERDPGALPWGDLGVDVVVESTGLLHRPRGRGRSTSPPARRRSSSPRPRPTRTSPSSSASTTTPTTPTRTTSSRTPRARRTASRRWRRCCTSSARSQTGLHDDDPRVHERPGHPRLPAQGPAARPRGRDQPDPDLDRRREGDRARPARAPGQGRRDLGPRSRPDRLDHRPRRLARARDERRRGQRAPSATPPPARSTACSSTGRTRSSPRTSSRTRTRASSTAS